MDLLRTDLIGLNFALSNRLKLMPRRAFGLLNVMTTNIQPTVLKEKEEV